MHRNREMNLDRSFNLLNKVHFEYGKRWKGSRYIFVSVFLNYLLLAQEQVTADCYIKSAVFKSGKFLILIDLFAALCIRDSTLDSVCWFPATRFMLQANIEDDKF